MEHESALIGMLLSLSKKGLDLSNLSAEYETLLKELADQGFEKEQAVGAVEWLMGIAEPIDGLDTDPDSTRVFTPEELHLLAKEDISLLIFMEKLKIITPAIRERVIANILSLYRQGAPAPAAAWVTYLVLSLDGDNLEERRKMELLLVKNCQGGVH